MMHPAEFASNPSEAHHVADAKPNNEMHLCVATTWLMYSFLVFVVFYSDCDPSRQADTDGQRRAGNFRVGFVKSESGK